jgi:hypothetical protein
LIAGTLLFLDWFLLWSRFLSAGMGKAVQGIFWVLNFPWSVPYLWLERQTNPWWRRTFGEPLYVMLNDELGPMIVLILIVLVQAFLFALIITTLKRRSSS